MPNSQKPVKSLVITDQSGNQYKVPTDGITERDIKPLNVMNQGSEVPVFEYDPLHGANPTQRPLTIKHGDTPVGTYHPFGSGDTEVTIPKEVEMTENEVSDFLQIFN